MYTEFSHRKSHHAELLLSGELLTHDDSALPFVDKAASSLLQFRHDCNHFDTVLRDRMKLLKEIQHIHTVSSVQFKYQQIIILSVNIHSVIVNVGDIIRGGG